MHASAPCRPMAKYLAYVLNEEGNESLWLRHMATESNVQIVKPEHVHYEAMCFSLDGSYIYFTHSELASGPESQDYDLYRTPVLGGNPQVLIKDIDSTPSFSPDGQRFVFLRANDPEPGKYFVLMANADGSGEKTIFTGSMTVPLFAPVWSPDGTVIAALVVSAVGRRHYLSGDDRSCERQFEDSVPIERHGDPRPGVVAAAERAGHDLLRSRTPSSGRDKLASSAIRNFSSDRLRRTPTIIRA